MVASELSPTMIPWYTVYVHVYMCTIWYHMYVWQYQWYHWYTEYHGMYVHVYVRVWHTMVVHVYEYVPMVLEYHGTLPWYQMVPWCLRCHMLTTPTCVPVAPVPDAIAECLYFKLFLR